MRNLKILIGDIKTYQHLNYVNVRKITYQQITPAKNNSMKIKLLILCH